MKDIINVYDSTIYKKEGFRVMNSKKDNETRNNLNNYLFETDICGDGVNREIILTASFLGEKGGESLFTLDESDIDKFINLLQSAREKIEKNKSVKKDLEKLHDKLNEYLEADYVKSIKLVRNDELMPPYFNPLLFIAFEVCPVFKEDVPDTVDRDFRFLEVLHLSIDESAFDETMNYIRNYKDISIHIHGFNREKEVEKRYKESMKEADRLIARMKSGQWQKEKEKYYKMMMDMGIPITMLREDPLKMNKK